MTPSEMMRSTVGKHPSHQSSSSSSSQYKGVRKRKWGKWVSEIRLPNSRERIWLGSYDTPEKAARAFDAALFCLRGRGAKFNFPDNPPEIPGGQSLSRSEIQAAAAKYANEEPLEVNRFENEPQNMDWEFLDLLSVSGSGGAGSVSDFGVFSGVNDFPGEFLPLPPPEVDYGDENDAGIFNQQSFLWNF
ncbi:AP2/ERF domain [Macleaya cordata]|uniref:AP2/ERF domain n=1 Tax=Macleaya cordata TaxID=56857 RepID=A0A200QM08_MACCD|nr:AP2/ERF domain [Macleaya cordata]